MDPHLAESQIYSSCEEAYRLTETGDIKVPYAYVEQYCHGPCLSETHLVLNCVENVMKHFVFYNKATIEAIRETIKAGCSYGPERGSFLVYVDVFWFDCYLKAKCQNSVCVCFLSLWLELELDSSITELKQLIGLCDTGDFNVAEHLQAEENRADNTQIKILSGLGLAIIGHTILF